MATTLDWVKSLRADIRGDCGKGWNLRGREVGGKMVMQIDRNDENGRSMPVWSDWYIDDRKLTICQNYDAKEVRKAVLFIQTK